MNTSPAGRKASRYALLYGASYQTAYRVACRLHQPVKATRGRKAAKKQRFAAQVRNLKADMRALLAPWPDSWDDYMDAVRWTGNYFDIRYAYADAERITAEEVRCWAEDLQPEPAALRRITIPPLEVPAPHNRGPIYRDAAQRACDGLARKLLDLLAVESPPVAPVA